MLLHANVELDLARVLSAIGEEVLRRCSAVDAEQAAVMRTELHMAQAAPAEAAAPKRAWLDRLRRDVDVVEDEDLELTPLQPKAEPPRAASIMVFILMDK